MMENPVYFVMCVMFINFSLVSKWFKVTILYFFIFLVFSLDQFFIQVTT